MQQVLDKQHKSLEKLVELSKQDRLLQLIQTKETLNIDEDGDKTVKQLEKIDESIKAMSEKLNDKGKDGVNSNVIKMHKEITKSVENTKQLIQRIPITADQAKGITDSAMERRQYRGIGDRVGAVKESVKDFFTVRGFLDKTGIVQRGTGGILSDTLDRREERQKYVQARMKMDPTARLHGEDKAKQIFARQFDEQQNIQRNMRENESKISSYKKLGFTEEQIRRSEEFKRRETLATDLAKVDTRVRPERFDAKTGMIKVAPESTQETTNTANTKRTKPSTAKEQSKAAKKTVIAADVYLEPKRAATEAAGELQTSRKVRSEPATAIEQTKSAKKVRSEPVISADDDNAVARKVRSEPATAIEQTKSAKKTVIAAENDTVTRTQKSKPQKANVQKATAGADASGSILSSISNVIPFPRSQSKEKDAPTVAAALGSEEANLEQSRKIDEQNQILKQIEENTRGVGGKGSAKEQPKESSGGGILDSIMGFLGNGIMSAFKFLFNPKNLLKVFTKFLAPAMIIGSLVNGIIDGFKAFAETGSIGEALIAGLGGVLSFLTFGLFDAETVRNVVDAVTGFVNDYIVEPVTNFINFIGEAFNTYIKEPIMAAFETVSGLFDEYIVQPLKTVFEPVTNFFKSLKETVFGWFENFEIPGINFKVFGKQFGFGPWRPFKSESAAAPAAPVAQSAQQPVAANQEAAKVAPASQPQSGNAVAKQSEQNKEANIDASKPVAGGGNTIVSAPTVNNVQHTQQTIKLPPRNRDNSLSSYLSSRYA